MASTQKKTEKQSTLEREFKAIIVQIITSTRSSL